jgi:hypothetical protein
MSAVRSLPMNLTLTRPAATLSHPMGEGLGVRALFQWKFMAPMRVHKRMEALHVQGSAVIDRRL